MRWEIKLLIFVIFLILVYHYSLNSWNPYGYPPDYYDSAYHVAQTKNIIKNNFMFPLKEPNAFYGRPYAYPPLFHYLAAIVAVFSNEFFSVWLLGNVFVIAIIPAGAYLCYLISKKNLFALILGTFLFGTTSATLLYWKFGYYGNIVGNFFTVISLICFYLVSEKKLDWKFLSLSIFLVIISSVINAVFLVLSYLIFFTITLYFGIKKHDFSSKTLPWFLGKSLFFAILFSSPWIIRSFGEYITYWTHPFQQLPLPTIYYYIPFLLLIPFAFRKNNLFYVLTIYILLILGFWLPNAIGEAPRMISLAFIPLYPFACAAFSKLFEFSSNTNSLKKFSFLIIIVILIWALSNNYKGYEHTPSPTSLDKDRIIFYENIKDIVDNNDTIIANNMWVMVISERNTTRADEPSLKFFRDLESLSFKQNLAEIENSYNMNFTYIVSVRSNTLDENTKEVLSDRDLVLYKII